MFRKRRGGLSLIEMLGIAIVIGLFVTFQIMNIVAVRERWRQTNARAIELESIRTDSAISAVDTTSAIDSLACRDVRLVISK